MDASAPGELATVADRYELLANHTRDLIYFTDDAGHIVEANAAALRAYGYAASDIIGSDAADLQTETTRAAATRAVARARGGETVVVETEQRRKNGATFPVEMTITSRRTASGAECLTIVRDISAQQAADESIASSYDSAVAAARIKSEFVAAMGHEIRTPMNTILGMTELLLDTRLTDDQRKFGEGVRQAGISLLEIIDDVLDFTQIESGGPEFVMADADIRSCVESAVARFTAQAAERGLALTSRCDPKIDAALRIDATRLRQILVRLIDNAVKFSERGEIIVSALLEERDEWSTTVRFAVEDSGSGIEPKVARAIFEPFVQADGSPTRKHAGTGLGLPIARRLVELMGGTLTVQSVPSAGSTFAFNAAFERVAPTHRSDAAMLVGARVLVVDDDPMSREILRRYLESRGIFTDEATGGAEALELLRSRARAGKPYDVAMIDYTMPGGMGGLELGMRIKADPEIAGTQLILITAYTDLQLRQAVSEAGFSSYLAKPIDRSLVVERVTNAVRFARGRTNEASDDSSDPVPRASRTKRILLAEDHPTNQQICVRQLKKLGFDATAVNNGEQVLAALSASSYDLILMDCQMPVMDGFAATQAIRAEERRTGRHVTIVAMTANGLVEDRRECLAVGMDDYLAKPVQLEDLQTIVQRWIWDAAVAVR